MFGVELVKHRINKEPAAGETEEIRKKCHERGLLIMACGALHNFFRLMFPLVISDGELRTGLDIFEESLKELTR
jgi:4-aminobutyrate aminotransferase / (S)-3-amino-2-methylpropionate transaminase / 5-aminovalerate transaminase